MSAGRRGPKGRTATRIDEAGVGGLADWKALRPVLAGVGLLVSWPVVCGHIPSVEGASGALSASEMRREQLLDEALAQGRCPHREDIEGVRRQMKAARRLPSDTSAKHLLREICRQRGFGNERQAQVSVFGASADGLPVDLAALRTLEVCTRTRCQPVSLVQKSGGVMSNAQGDATLIAQGEIAGDTLVRVRVRLRGDDGREHVQEMDFPHRVDTLRLPRDAAVLLSLQAGSCGAAVKPCLKLRHAVAEAFRGREAGPKDANTLESILVYNPAEGLQRDLGMGVSLSIPPGALDEVRLLLPVIRAWVGTQPWPDVTFMQIPPIRFAKKMQITLHALPQEADDKAAADTAADDRAVPDAQKMSIESDTTHLERNRPAGDTHLSWRKEARIHDECYLEPSRSDCNYRFLFDELGRQLED